MSLVMRQLRQSPIEALIFSRVHLFRLFCDIHLRGLILRFAIDYPQSEYYFFSVYCSFLYCFLWFLFFFSLIFDFCVSSLLLFAVGSLPVFRFFVASFVLIVRSSTY